MFIFHLKRLRIETHRERDRQNEGDRSDTERQMGGEKQADISMGKMIAEGMKEEARLRVQKRRKEG